jgi:DNA invertase Pin-like site-specific DNA recombinase
MSTMQPNATILKLVVLLYARISLDPRDQKRGVRRQLEDLRAFSSLHPTWQPGGEFWDNDISALNGDERPDYDKLMAKARAVAETGARPVIAAYHPSRLWRNRPERALAIEELRKLRAFVAFESGGFFDLTKATDRSQLANLGESDTLESEVKGERVARTALERAQEGRANGAVAYGWQRVYEHDDRGRVVGFHDIENPEQAAVVRQIVDDLLGGKSVLAITDDLNTRGVPAPGAGQNRKRRAWGQDENGTRWSKSSVRKIALRPANAGIRVHHGDEYKAAWPALITPEKHARIKRLFADRADTWEKPGARKHLLSWGAVPLATCGYCHEQFRVASRGNAKKPTYVCEKGCVGRNETALDDFVSKLAVGVLSQPFAVDVFKGDDAAAVKALERAEGLRARLDAAADDYAEGQIDRTQLQRITKKLRAQIAEAQEEARRLQPTFDPSAIDGLVGPKAGERWQALEVSQKRRVLEGLGLRIVVNKALRKGPVFCTKSIQVRWGVPDPETT